MGIPYYNNNLNKVSGTFRSNLQHSAAPSIDTRGSTSCEFEQQTLALAVGYKHGTEVGKKMGMYAYPDCRTRITDCMQHGAEVGGGWRRVRTCLRCLGNIGILPVHSGRPGMKWRIFYLALIGSEVIKHLEDEFCCLTNQLGADGDDISNTNPVPHSTYLICTLNTAGRPSTLPLEFGSPKRCGGLKLCGGTTT